MRLEVVWPAGKKDELCEFADTACPIRMTTTLQMKGRMRERDLLTLFINLIKGMADKPAPKTREERLSLQILAKRARGKDRQGRHGLEVLRRT